MRSSISDTHKYKNIIKQILINESLFNKFKQLPDYTEILEHTSESQAKDYLKIIERDNNELINDIYKFKANDNFGTPNKILFENIGYISPSTLRYVKVLSDLIMLDDFNDKNIVEIGGGYGGQCLVFSKYFNFKSYTLIDLKESVDLSEKYLNLNKIDNVFYKDITQLKNTDNYDLVISNYAFTECDKNIQDTYINKVLNNSKGGYITANFISDIFNINSYKLDELINLISNDITIEEEEPKTHKNNSIIIW